MSEIKAGIHMLSGVEEIPDAGTDKYGDGYGKVYIQLDGINYEFMEDYDDGYRSYCHDEVISDHEPKFCFDPIPLAVFVINTDYFEGLSFVDFETNKEVLKIGTDYSEDYYPCCIFDWTPENLSVNKEVN